MVKKELPFEEVVKQLNAKNFIIASLRQENNKKKWQVTLVQIKGKKSSDLCHGGGKTVYEATRNALQNFASKLTEKEWKKIKENQIEKKSKKRKRIKI